MRALLISDIHANPWALEAVLKDAGPVDTVLCAGDVVNYGPDPVGAIEWVMQLHATTVRGNHDHAVAFGVDPVASPSKQAVAIKMRDWTHGQITAPLMAWLVALPRRFELSVGGTRFAMVHATPVDPLYDYRLKPDASEALLDDLTAHVNADVLFVGHTHLPLLRQHGGLQIVNPGSVGQPLDGDPRAAYAIWNDGDIKLCRVDYDRTELFSRLLTLPIAAEQIQNLKQTLETGRIPQPVPSAS